LFATAVPEFLNPISLCLCSFFLFSLAEPSGSGGKRHRNNGEYRLRHGELR
jgi:hypothetical protein